MFFSNHKHNTLVRRLQSLAVLLLLLFYVAANVEFEALHHEFHADHHISHTEADEQDPCHLSLYHQATKEGCHHDAHITAAKKCPLCHVSMVTEKILTALPVSANLIFSEHHPSIHSPFSVQACYPLVPSRGPPSRSALPS
jgi:hypothetical protein